MLEPRRDDAATDQLGADVADDSFDFGELWHGVR
jgi:hypothetical protein